MKRIFCLLSTVFSLGACDGGGLGSSTAQNKTTPSKPLVDYRPNYFSIAAGSYSTLCDLGKSPKTFTLSLDGLLSPGIGGVVDLKSPKHILSFGRGKLGETQSVDALDVGFSVVGSNASNNPTTIGIESRDGGLILGFEVVNGAGNILHCETTPTAVSLKSKTAYAAFAKFIDAKKTSVMCFDVFAPIPKPMVSSTYEIAEGKLTVQDEVIPLLSGISYEGIGDTGRVIKNGLDIQNITYTVERSDGRKVILVLNEYGKTVGLQYKSSSGKTFQCTPLA
jgi:hypothetical protein